MENNNLIRIENVQKTYHIGETQVHALRGISFNIKKGALMAIMGPSGSGKSTLMNIIGCLDRPTGGQYILEEEEVSTMNKNKLAGIRNQRIGFVFQTFNLLPRTSALENTELPLIYSQISRKEAREKAFQSLASVGLKGREHHLTNQLSGGEQQRVAIARALVNNPSLILADEPTGNLDTKTEREIMKIFQKLNEEKNITVILVTHDPEVARFTLRKIHLRDGQIESVEGETE